jgi:endonuclease/exonuclease/phosphatase family metal-dependent hydrolase
VNSDKPGKKKSFLNRLMFYLNLLAIGALLLTYLSFHVAPTTLGYLSIIGLGYPLILLLNVGFMVFWVFRKWKYTLFSLFFILLGFNHVRSCITWSSPEPLEEDRTPVSVMSFNAHLFGVYWSKNNSARDSIYSMLRREKADIICFQEFYQREEKEGMDHRNQLMDRLKLGYFHERYTHATSGKEYFGVTILSKYPIIHKGYIPFEGDANNFCIYADIKVKGDTIRVYDGHLASIRFQQEDYALFDETTNQEEVERGALRVARLLRKGYRKREEQALKVAESVAASPHPVVLCGDFNDTPVSYCYNILTENLDDSFVEKGNGLGNTHISNIPATLRIDYILTSPEIQVMDYKRVPLKLSDHHPIVVELGL